ncbi:MAG: hypothetical protein A2073_05060 [Deltaproteobacteria bacterium GWC2_42_11]|nr:MAG: hypothetical protein A2073_05060 [Deltaproteobacteria bacterium GWC2_42_11]
MKILLLPALLANRLDGRLLEATGLQAGQAATAKRYFQVKKVIIKLVLTICHKVFIKIGVFTGRSHAKVFAC